jgi:hypothetical protein
MPPRNGLLWKHLWAGKYRVRAGDLDPYFEGNSQMSKLLDLLLLKHRMEGGELLVSAAVYFCFILGNWKYVCKFFK